MFLLSTCHGWLLKRLFGLKECFLIISLQFFFTNLFITFFLTHIKFYILIFRWFRIRTLSLIYLNGQRSLWWFFVCSFNIFLIFQVLLLLQAFHSLQRWLWAWFQRWATRVVSIFSTLYLLQINTRDIVFLFWTGRVNRLVFIAFFLIKATFLLSLLALSIFFLRVHLWLSFWWTNLLQLEWHHFFRWTSIPLFFCGRNVFHVFLLKFTWRFQWRLGRTFAGASIFHIHQSNIFPWLSDLAMLSLDEFEELVKNLSSSFTVLWISN